MILKTLLRCLALTAAGLLVATSPASAKSSIKVGLADQSSAMFDAPEYKALKMKRTRYFVPADVMQDAAERAKAKAFIEKARANGVSTLLHISTSDLRAKRGPLVSTTAYRSNVNRIVVYFRKLGVKDFGAWNEVNHKTQETWNHVGNAVSYFKSMYQAVHQRCSTCSVVGLDLLDQVGVENYIKSFYTRLDARWRMRLKVVGIHNYSDVNRNRSTGTAKIIKNVRKYNKRAKFWFTETGALASFGASFRYSESRQASRIKSMFTYASRYKPQGVERIYSYNWFGAENGTSCGSRCKFDAGLVDPQGAAPAYAAVPRPVYFVFKEKAANYSR